MPAQLSFVDRSVGIALRRLVGQSLLNNLSLWLGVTTGIALAWFFVQPLLLESPPVWLRWTVLAGLTAVGLSMALWQTIRKAPTRQQAALEVDSRFDLRERVTTALALTPDLLETPAGRAVSADAEAKAKKLAVGERFPVKPRWTAVLTPLFALAMAAVILWWNPSPLAFGGDGTTVAGTEGNATKPTPEVAKKAATDLEKKIAEAADRKNRDEKLAELEKEIKDMTGKFDKERYDDIPPEKAREKVAELTKLEEKMEKYAKEKERDLRQLAAKLNKLDKLNNNDEFADGGAEQLNDALAKGNLEKAEEELEGLKKKAEDKMLSDEDVEKLSKQLDKIEDELKRLDREREEKKKELQKQKEKAQKENRLEDAAELDRELEKLEQEQEAGREELEELGQQLQRASDAFDMNNQEEAAKALDKARKAVQGMKGKVDEKAEDLREAEMRLQQLKGERKKACAECEGNCKSGNKDPKASKSMKNEGGVGLGEREWNPEADTGFEEVRKRSLLDLRGETQYGGLTKGKGFTKKTDKELGEQLQRAAQDAPGAADLQRLPRDAKESVAEYFKKLGGTEGK
ncbi:MAG: hypothetical protein MUF18_17105 [Fimbriiglobus sp.]|nr:hypothetical protein [Fimbriiglobus sp.]